MESRAKSRKISHEMGLMAQGCFAASNINSDYLVAFWGPYSGGHTWHFSDFEMHLMEFHDFVRDVSNTMAKTKADQVMFCVPRLLWEIWPSLRQ